MLQKTIHIGKSSNDDDNRIQFIWPGMTCKKAASVGILLSSRAKLTDTNYVSPQILQVLSVTNRLRLVITCCYAPTVSMILKKETFYCSLRHIIELPPSPPPPPPQKKSYKLN